MKKIIVTLGSVSASFGLPLVALAQSGSQVTTILTNVQGILNAVVPITLTLGVIMLAWSIIQLVTTKNEEERGKAKGLMIMIIIGIFVIVSIWGIVAFIGNFFGIGQGGTSVVPCVIDSDNNPYNGC